MSNRHAYLIIAHNNWNQLKVLLQLLDDERNDIYLHIDKKSKVVDRKWLSSAVRESGLYFVPQINVQWGGYSQVECEINLIEKALERDYSYLHLLSGTDLPLKTQDEIHRFFEENTGKEFIQFNSSPMAEKYLDRIKYYHFFQNICGRKKNIWFYFDKVSLKLQKMLGINRLTNCEYEFQKGTQWFSITATFAKYVLEKKKVFQKYFRYSFCSDEMFLQTVFANSCFKENLFDKSYNNNHYACLRKIDWNRGEPYTFRKEDFEELIASPHLFARKFDETVDNGIIKKISEHLRGREYE